MFVTYFTIYAGSKMPPFYIGSTSKKRFLKGYFGTVSSQKYKSIWQSELKNNPHLFTTEIVEEFSTRNESIDAEEKLQRLHNAVKSEWFINMAYARGGFINCKESFTPEVRAKMRAAKLGKKLTEEHKVNSAAARIGSKRSDEQKERMRQAALTRKKAPPKTAEHREKLRQAAIADWKKRKENKNFTTK